MSDLDRKGDMDVRITDETNQYTVGVDIDNRLKSRTIITNGTIDTSVVADGVKNRLCVDAAVTFDDILGLDDYADTWFRILTIGNDGDTINVTFKNYGEHPAPEISVTVTKTASETTVDLLATKIALALAANVDFNAYFKSRTVWNWVFITSQLIAERGEIPYSGVLPGVVITVTGAITYELPVGNDVVVRRNKLNLVQPDPDDPRYGAMNVRGDVSSVTKADNPIHTTVRKSVASTKEQVFIDKTVPAKQVWYLTNIVVADDSAAEFRLYAGLQRAKVETFTGNGTNKEFYPVNNVISFATYVSVRVGGVLQTLDSDYWVYINPSDETGGWINMKVAPGNGVAVQVTYDATKIVFASFVQASSQSEMEFGAPVKLTSGKFYVSSITNKSGAAAVGIANINGYFEETLT